VRQLLLSQFGHRFDTAAAFVLSATGLKCSAVHAAMHKLLLSSKHHTHLYLQMFARQANACPSISMCGLLRLQLRMNSSSAVTPPFSTISWQQALL
jgi:hypothetical protein